MNIPEVLKDINGKISSKRVVMFILLILFITEILANLFYGKPLDTVEQSELFILLNTALGTVFLESPINNIGKPKVPTDAK